MDTELSYESALQELFQIQKELENNLVAIDQLAAKIDRAYFLLNFCRDKLRAAEDHIARLTNASQQK